MAWALCVLGCLFLASERCLVSGRMLCCVVHIKAARGYVPTAWVKRVVKSSYAHGIPSISIHMAMTVLMAMFVLWPMLVLFRFVLGMRLRNRSTHIGKRFSLVCSIEHDIWRLNVHAWVQIISSPRHEIIFVYTTAVWFESICLLFIMFLLH